MSEILNCRHTYNTNEKWEAYKAKKAALRKEWEGKILDKLNITADTGYSITQSVSEIFTVVLTGKPVTI